MRTKNSQAVYNEGGREGGREGDRETMCDSLLMLIGLKLRRTTLNLGGGRRGLAM